MRILLTHVYAWPEVRRGGERYLHELSSALVRAGHDVVILTTAPEPSIDFVIGVEVRYLRRRRLRMSRSYLSVELPFAIHALILALRMKFDVWHAFGRADAAAAAIHAKLKGSVSVYTALGLPYAPSASPRSNTIIQKFLVARIDHYLTLSQEAARLLEVGWGRKAIVVGGGVNLTRFQPSARAKRPTILYSGDLNVPRKNVGLLIEALDLVAQEQAEVTLWLSGPGNLAPLIDDLSDDLRARIVCFGQQEPDQVIALYGQAWVTALPSTEEAFGLVLIESLACGTPVVALAEGGPNDIVSDMVGAKAAGPEPRLLAEACLKALAMAREEDIVQRCRLEAAKYDWDASIVPRLERIYGADSDSM